MSRVTSLEMSLDLTSSTSTSSSFSITTNSDCEKLTVATVTRIQAKWSRAEFHVCVWWFVSFLYLGGGFVCGGLVTLGSSMLYTCFFTQ